MSLVAGKSCDVVNWSQPAFVPKMPSSSKHCVYLRFCNSVFLKATSAALAVEAVEHMFFGGSLSFGELFNSLGLKRPK